MAKIRGAIVVDIEKCKGCEVCVGACPTDVIGMSTKVNGKGYHYAYMKNPEVGAMDCNGFISSSIASGIKCLRAIHE